jgi:antitoxin ChpS
LETQGGIVIPAPLLQQLNTSGVDAFFEGDVVKGKLVLKPVSKKKKYTLSSLIEKCDDSAPMPKSIGEWDSVNPIGNEL